MIEPLRVAVNEVFSPHSACKMVSWHIDRFWNEHRGFTSSRPCRLGIVCRHIELARHGRAPSLAGQRTCDNTKFPPACLPADRTFVVQPGSGPGRTHAGTS